MKSGDLVGIGVAIAIAAIIGFVVVGMVIGGAEKTHPNRHDKVEAYGNLTYGAENFTTYRAAVVGGHGGIHIELDNGTVVHPHDIREGVLTRAYWIEQANGTAEPWPPRNAYKPWHQRAPWATLLGAIPFAMFLILLLVVAAWSGLYHPRT